MRCRLGRAILVAAAVATAGCATPPGPAAAPRRDAPSVALASPNLVMLAEERGVELVATDLATRNDPPRGRSLADAPRETWVLRDVWDRQDVVGGRTRLDNRATTRLREWWQY